jgi:hypothetical protein
VNGYAAMARDRERLGRWATKHASWTMLGGYLAGAGIRTLAAATYPQAGPDDGRSLAIVLDAADGDEPRVTDLWKRLIADLEVENGRAEGREPGDGSS